MLSRRSSNSRVTPEIRGSGRSVLPSTRPRWVRNDKHLWLQRTTPCRLFDGRTDRPSTHRKGVTERHEQADCRVGWKPSKLCPKGEKRLFTAEVLRPAVPCDSGPSDDVETGLAADQLFGDLKLRKMTPSRGEVWLLISAWRRRFAPPLWSVSATAT